MATSDNDRQTIKGAKIGAIATIAAAVIALIPFFLNTCNSSVNKISITGIVKDRHTDLGIPNAELLVVGEASRCISESNGNFSFTFDDASDNESISNVRVRVTHPDYQSLELTLPKNTSGNVVFLDGAKNARSKPAANNTTEIDNNNKKNNSDKSSKIDKQSSTSQFKAFVTLPISISNEPRSINIQCDDCLPCSQIPSVINKSGIIRLLLCVDKTEDNPNGVVELGFYENGKKLKHISIYMSDPTGIQTINL